MDGGAAPWSKIISLYDQLIAIADSPAARLNRAIAVGEAGDPKAALRELDALQDERSTTEGFYLHAARARFLTKISRNVEAVDALERAREVATDPAEVAFAERKRCEIDVLAQ
jgi:RNA polymerase sigma-70 factor (ECF subfamily)